MGNLFWNMYFPDQGNYSMTPSLQEVDSLAPQFLSSSARLISSLAIFTLHLNFPKYEITHNSMNWLSALSLEDSPFNFSPSSASSWQYCFFCLFSHLYSTYCHKQPRCAASVLGGIEGVHPSPSFPRFSYFSLTWKLLRRLSQPKVTWNCGALYCFPEPWLLCFLSFNTRENANRTHGK